MLYKKNGGKDNMLEKYNIEEELEEKGTKIRIKNITYNDSPLDIENESKSLFFFTSLQDNGNT